MGYWLVKSEPETYSIDDLQKDNITTWDGVRNYQARNFMKQMKKDDLVLIYHSVSEKQIKGIAKVVKEYYPDSTDSSGKFCVVDLEFVEKLENGITRKEIKQIPQLQSIPLIAQSRLSVMPLDQDHYHLIVQKST